MGTRVGPHARLDWPVDAFAGYLDGDRAVTRGRPAMSREQPATPAVKMLYRPFALVFGTAGGLIAARVFREVWMRSTPHHRLRAPTALESQFNARQVMVAAAVQGAVFGLVKAGIDRAGARAFQRWTGEWPGQ